MDEPDEEKEKRAAKLYALRLLNRQLYHSTDLAERLKKREHSQEIIRPLIDELLELGYLDDLAYVRGRVKSEFRKTHGPRWVRQKLREKGIPRDEVELVLSETYDEEQAREQLCRIALTRYSKLDPTDFKDRQKLMAALQRRGYDFQIIQGAIEDLASERL